MDILNYDVFSRPLFQDTEILSLKLLEVDEGGRALITPRHLNVILDYPKYGIRESGVLFHVVQDPSHGKLDVSVWEKSGDNIFTLLDLNTDKVRAYGLRNGDIFCEVV